MIDATRLEECLGPLGKKGYDQYLPKLLKEYGIVTEAASQAIPEVLLPVPRLFGDQGEGGQSY
jgi:hypothetical protein